MKLSWSHGAVLLATVAISACGMGGGGDKAPTGQVVATVDGEEITAMELNAELAGVQVADPAQRKQVEQAALQRIIARKLLAQQAKEQKVDKTPAFAQQLARSNETLLAAAAQRKMAEGVPEPPRQEAETFISENPQMFAQRRMMVVDQIVTGTLPEPVLKALQPTTTMEQVEGVFQANGVDFQRTTTILDSLTAPKPLLDTILKLPPGEIFVFPRANAVFVNQVRDNRVLPFTGDRAVRYATNGLKSMKTQETVNKKTELLIKGSEAKIKYNDAYKPPPPAKAAPKAAAPAPAAAPAAAPPPAAAPNT